MTTPDLVDRTRVVRAVRLLEVRVLAVGVLIPAATVAMVFASGLPPLVATLPLTIAVIIGVWALWWYGSLARAVARGDSTLAVVVTRRQAMDHAYLDVQPVDGSPQLRFVVPSRRRVLDGHPAQVIGDRASGRLVIASDMAISIPLRPAVAA